MRKLLLWLIGTVFTGGGFSEVYSQTQNPVLEKLVKSSDIILQGIIVRKEHVAHTIGSVEFQYIIQVDSVLKGEPNVYHDLKGEYIRPEQSMTHAEMETSIRVIYFLRDCVHYIGVLNPSGNYIVENCYEEGDHIILFLEDNRSQMEGITNEEIRYRNILVDEWLGILEANSRLSSEIKTLVKVQTID